MTFYVFWVVARLFSSTGPFPGLNHTLVGHSACTVIHKFSFFGDQTQPLATPHMRPQLNNYRRSQHSLECKDPCRLIRDLDLSPVHPKINAFQESSWNICMTSLVILAATCFFRYRVKKNIQTNRQTEEHRPYPATSGGVGENPARMSW